METERVRLTGWFDWEEGKESIRALLFGAMVERAIPVTKHYLSDLYHDAVFVAEKVNGPTTFDWLVRQCGTDLNDTAHTQVNLGPGSDAVFYRVTLLAERGLWFADFTTVPLAEVAGLGKVA